MIQAGQLLYEERLKKGLTLDEVARAIKIKVGFLIAIEKGDYQKLPKGAYAHGFIRNYAEFLGLSNSKILALFRREFDEEKDFNVLPKGLPKSPNSSFSYLKVRSAGIFIILFFLSLLGYILFQYRYAILNPPLEVSVPSEMAVISSSVIEVFGRTESNTTVFINGVPAFLDQNGVFKKSIDIFPGKTTIEIRAVNRFGRETVIKRHVEVR